MRRLTKDEAELLAGARRLLTDLAKSASSEGWGAPAATLHGEDGLGGFRLGLIYERCDRAEGAIFDALNGLSSYADDLEARAAIESAHEAMAADIEAAGEVAVDAP